MLMDAPLSERWVFLSRLLQMSPHYHPRPALPGVPEKQAQLKAALPVIYTQYQFTSAQD